MKQEMYDNRAIFEGTQPSDSNCEEYNGWFVGVLNTPSETADQDIDLNVWFV